MGMTFEKTVDSTRINGSSVRPGANLRIVTVTVSRTPDFYDYRSMFERAVSELGDDLDGLTTAGYRLYYFLPGAKLTAQWTRENKTYDLANALAKAEIDVVAKVEVDIASGDRRRSIGLYAIDEADLVAACMLQAAKPPCCIAFSRDRTFLSEGTLRGLYHANGPDDLSALRAPADWRGLADELCARDNILLRASGAFDDLNRSISLIARRRA